MQEFEHSHQPDHEQDLRKLILPSGKTIALVSLDNPAPAGEDLHICSECSSELVYPIAWEEADSTSWDVTLRCPNCESAVSGIFEDEIIQRFDDTLDRGTETLVSELRRLARANMEEDVERFCAALYAGHLLPEDF